MSDETLRIELTPAERKKCYGTVAVSFSIDGLGVHVTEHWPDMDELWGESCTVTIPPRAWREAMPWILQRLPPA